MTDAEPLIRDLPDPEAATRFLASLAEKHPLQLRQLRKSNALLSDILTLVAYSPLLASTLLQHPEYIAWLKRKRAETVVRNKDELLESLARFSLTNSQIEPQILLSRFRRRELLRIFLRDIRQLATIAEITEEISNLADAILEHALRLAKQELNNRYGAPLETDDKGRKLPADICIVSLGKLGSKELNYASDIDLFFLYSAEGMTSGIGDRDPMSNREYFIKLAETIVRLVGQQTGEGAAYRVDLRLRPHGRVGPLAMSCAETVRYYQTEAEAWERQVLIRSRSSAGAERIFREFIDAVAATVFAANVSVSEALRRVGESKQKIDLENITAKGTNVKLGIGGIREIEFIAQALQLAYGGRDRWLRSPHTLISLVRLADRKLLTDHELTELADAYAFLRQLEHILQMENGLQTHTVPNDEVRRSLIARRMRFADLATFESAVAGQMRNVNRVFKRIFADVNIDQTVNAGDSNLSYSANEIDLPVMNGSTVTEESGIDDLIRISPRFAEILRADPTIAERLNNTNELCDVTKLRARMHDAVTAETDLRSQLLAMRTAWRNALAEIMAADIAESISMIESKVQQTALAEASIEAALVVTRAELDRRYDAAFDELPLAVMGLGKLGGAGLDYDSDLDLVMIYDDAAIANAPELFSRAVEIFVNTLSAMTRNGSLYRVDLRLRPHGKDGPLAISRSAFSVYMRNDSAIWELLAFVKLRGVGGDRSLARDVETEIRDIIHRKAASIDAAELAAETKRIRLGLEKQRADVLRSRDIDIKYGEGGMLDIYFAIRFLQLRDNLPDDDENRSTGRTLVRLKEAGSLAADEFYPMLAGYEFLSALDHNIRLTVGRTTRLPVANEKALAIIADRMDLNAPASLLANLTAHRLDLRRVFESIIAQTD